MWCRWCRGVLRKGPDAETFKTGWGSQELRWVRFPYAPATALQHERRPVAALVGQYLYSDYRASFVKSVQLSGGAATNPQVWPTVQPTGSVSSFGQDAKGELYILTLNGAVYRIVPGP